MIFTVWEFIVEEKILGSLIGSLIGGFITLLVLFVNIGRDKRKDRIITEQNYLKSYTKIEYYLDKLKYPLEKIASLIEEKGIFNIDDYYFSFASEITKQCRLEIEKINIDYIPIEILKTFIRLQDKLLHIEKGINSRNISVHYKRELRDINEIFEKIKDLSIKNIKSMKPKINVVGIDEREK